MTVNELIERLTALPPELRTRPVCFIGGDMLYFEEIQFVKRQDKGAVEAGRRVPMIVLE
jgi:hypothetical protein